MIKKALKSPAYRDAIVHPHGDAIEIEVVDGEVVELSVKEGLHEICCLGFTGAELDVLIDRLRRARKKVTP